MSRPAHRADEPDDATTELPGMPHRGASDPLDPASLAWTTGTDAPAFDPAAAGGGSTAAGAPPSELSDVSFPTAWRGYEPTAVDAYVRQVTRTIADLRVTAAPPRPSSERSIASARRHPRSCRRPSRRPSA